MLEAIDYRPKPRLVYGPKSVLRLGELAKAEGFGRALFVADPGIMATAHAERAIRSLREAGVAVETFNHFGENPDSAMVERGRAFAAALPDGIDSLVGFGGGSSMDCAKAISFLLTNGGNMSDYRGFGKASNPLLPMIGVPTTAGTGSEAQSYALISDAETHVKMACGAESAMFRLALLDPELTVTQPRGVTATAGFDAIAHAVETYVTTKRNALSDTFARESFRLLVGHYNRVLSHPEDVGARGAMQLGAFFAGVAIENSMLGATHACANPLTQRYGTAHGRAISMLLPSVVRFNEEMPDVRARYAALMRDAGREGGDLAKLLEDLATSGGLPIRLRDDGIEESALDELADRASEQWTGSFNPRAFDRRGAAEIYRCAF